jgi:hypothetical protein
VSHDGFRAIVAMVQVDIFLSACLANDSRLSSGDTGAFSKVLPGLTRTVRGIPSEMVFLFFFAVFSFFPPSKEDSFAIIIQLIMRAAVDLRKSIHGLVVLLSWGHADKIRVLEGKLTPVYKVTRQQLVM